MFYQTQTARS